VIEGKALALRIGDALFVRPGAEQWGRRDVRGGDCLALSVAIGDGYLTVSYTDVKGAQKWTYSTHEGWTVEWDLTDAND